MNIHQGRVAALSVSKKKGIPKTNVKSVRLLEDWGIEGDAHAGKWHRQVSILAMESIEKMRAKGLNVRPGAFAENITTEFVDVPNLHVGDRVIIGDAELEVTQIGKECYTKCAIYFAAGDCIMPREGIFARVVRGGEIRVGDSAKVLPVEYYNMTGVILAGGKNSRMGQDKALLLLNDKPLIQHIAETLQKVFHQVIIISDRGKDYGFLGLPVYPDTYKDCGPLGGIHSALSVAKTQCIFVIPCDMPFVTTSLIESMIGKSSLGKITIASDGSNLHPLLGIYPTTVLIPLQQFLQAGSRKVFDFLQRWQDSYSVVDFSASGELLKNINTPVDYPQKYFSLGY